MKPREDFSIFIINRVSFFLIISPPVYNLCSRSWSWFRFFFFFKKVAGVPAPQKFHNYGNLIKIYYYAVKNFMIEAFFCIYSRLARRSAIEGAITPLEQKTSKTKPTNRSPKNRQKTQNNPRVFENDTQTTKT